MRSFFMLFVSIAIVFTGCQSKQEFEHRSSTLPSKFARPLVNTSFTSSPERLARGKYLVNGVLQCFVCHTNLDKSMTGWPPVADSIGSGSIFVHNDSIFFAAPNITPDKETGAGNWTDDVFVRAIRSGIGHDGRALSRMPWENYRNLTDEDLASVVIYIRSIPAIKNYLRPRMLSARRELELQNSPRPTRDPVYPAVDTSNAISKGTYLITVAGCIGCHTAWYERNPGLFGGGNIVANNRTDSAIASGNITADPTGIGNWNDEVFIDVIRNGKAGTMHHSMPWTVYRQMNDEDLKSILATLKTTYAVKHRIVNGIKPTFCEVCRERHGYGDHNKIELIISVPIHKNLLPLYIGKYISNFSDTILISIKNSKLQINIANAGDIELIAIGNNQFHGEGLASPIQFKADREGQIVGFVDRGIPALTASKIKILK